MKRVVTRLIVLFGAFCAGCGGAPVDPDRVTAHVLAAGEFAIREGVPVLVSPDQRIECELGRLFGVDYQISVPEGSSGPVPIALRWVHPQIEAPNQGVHGTETSGGRSNPDLERGQSNLAGRSLWSIAHPDELVSGRYVFEIRLTNGSRTILSHAFDLEGCQV